MGGYWERNPPDIFIAIPVSGAESVYYEWADQATQMALNIPHGMKVARARFPEPCIDITRNKAVRTAIQLGARWLFFLDSDIIPPNDVIARLISRNKPIVAGLYVRRHNPPFNEMLRLRTDGIVGLRPIQDGEYKDGDLVECDAVATGCLLIETWVFERIRPFTMTIDNRPANPSYFLWTESRIGPGFSEDFSWCLRARECGFRIYCDTSVKCKHLGPVKFINANNNGINIEWMGG